MIRRSTNAAVVLAALLGGNAFAEFSTCRFNVGVDLAQASTKKCGYMGCTTNLSDLNLPTGVDFVAKFTGHTDAGGGRITPAPQALQEGTFLAWAKTLNATPVYYTYIIAEGMKVALNLDKNQSDCNGTASKTICTEAGAYFSSYRSAILSQYTAFARDAATRWGTSKPMIWALEPDFYQYASTAKGNKNPLSFADAGKLIGEIADAIKSAMPNALISMDISPWAPENWFTALPLSKFSYMHTSGGISQPTANIKSNELSWAKIKQLTKLPIIADDGYGTGGGLTSPNNGWSDINNIKARMNDGVVGLMQAYPTSSWTSIISNIHTQTTGTCTGGNPTTPTNPTNPTPPKFNLTVSTNGNGSFTATPSGNSFDSGAVVKLKATPSNGQRFAGWTGSVTGSKDTITVVVNSNKNVIANFSQIPRYNLQIGWPNGGQLVVTPNGSSFDSGAVVGIKAKPYDGFNFTNWTGDVSGQTDTTTLIMTSHKNVSAVFGAKTATIGRKALSSRARVESGRLSVSTKVGGPATYTLVSVDGASRDLGRHDAAGQELSFRLVASDRGLSFLLVRGESRDEILPVVDLGR